MRRWVIWFMASGSSLRVPGRTDIRLRLVLLLTTGFCLLTTSAHAQVPGILNYQGRVVVNGTNFDGTGQFQFALVNTDGTATYWSNGVNAVTCTVTKGLYSVLLGDTGIGNMTYAIPAAVFANQDVRLRVWFAPQGSPLQQLTPDQRIAAVGYALVAGGVPAGAITSDQLASNLTITGTLTAGSFQGNGAMPWQTVSGTAQQATPNTGYALTNPAQTILTLPATANIGDVVQVSGVGAGGWCVAGDITGAPIPAGVNWTACAISTNWKAVASSADGSKLVAVGNGRVGRPDLDIVGFGRDVEVETTSAPG